MKVIILTLSIFFTQNAIASNGQKELLKRINHLYKKGQYNSSALYIVRLIKKGYKLPIKFEKIIEGILIKTGHELFDELSINQLKEQNLKSINYVLAYRLFKKRKYQELLSLELPPNQSFKFLTETSLLLGQTYSILSRDPQAIDKYKECISSSEAREKRAKKDKVKRYYTILKEQCVINTARIHFKNKKFGKALDLYDQIEKTSYMWPYTIMEKAWLSYHLKDYNRSIGLLITYKSPLLSSYFFPESEYLHALNYYRLCYIKDSKTVISNYYNNYRPKTKELEKILRREKKSDSYFLKLSLTKNVEQIHPFIRVLVTQIKKRTRYSIDLVNIKRLIKEIKKTKDQNLKSKLSRNLNWRKRKLNHFIKKEMFNFINSIYKYSYEMFNVDLNLISQRKEKIYTDNDLKEKDQGDFKNVKRKETQQYWDFNGAFWADELGDFSLGLKSKCIGEEK